MKNKKINSINHKKDFKEPGPWPDVLLGAKLVDISDKGITIKPRSDRENEYFLEFKQDSGECCGFNTIKTKCYFEKGSKRNPIITRISVSKDLGDDGNWCSLTFFGEDSMIAKVNSCSSSGSGWWYGACVTVECSALNLKEILTMW